MSEGGGPVSCEKEIVPLALRVRRPPEIGYVHRTMPFAALSSGGAKERRRTPPGRSRSSTVPYAETRARTTPRMKRSTSSQ